jgi:8-oxo-dGTP pyrophosphatase MutT (NUDIX family)
MRGDPGAMAEDLHRHFAHAVPQADPRLGRDCDFTRDTLLQRLAQPHAYLHTYPFDLWHQDRVPEGASARHAAVLIPLIARAEGVQVLLTQRTSHLNGHAGQISFPGGGVEPDDRSRQDTALRETEEEIGLPRSHIEVLGAMPDYEMSTGFRVAPVVGWIAPPYSTQPDPFEVHDIFEAPLAHFLAPANYQRRRYEIEGMVRKYVAVPYQGRYIWGATAGMLYFFFQLLRG